MLFYFIAHKTTTLVFTAGIQGYKCTLSVRFVCYGACNVDLCEFSSSDYGMTSLAYLSLTSRSHCRLLSVNILSMMTDNALHFSTVDTCTSHIVYEM